MSVVYRIDVLAALKEKGYSAYRLRKDKIFGERTIQAFRNRDSVSFDVLSKLCELMQCQPGDILRYTETMARDEADKEALVLRKQQTNR